MARIEIPARAFVEDFCSRAFPNRDFSRGSALSDLVIKPFAALLQPYRHELDVIKISQSVLNYLYMPTSAMDALAANQGYFRQTGARAFGDVTLYFDTATDYAFNYLEFVSDDSVTFLLTSPVSISAAALLRAKQTDGTYAATVSVRSVGVGNRYQLSAGRINTLRNRPSGVVRVTNLADFSITAPDETNFDIVNGMFRNLGLRNLVSRQSIRGPIYDQFPGILDIFVAGTGHPKMSRDLVKISSTLSAHVGGTVDVWVNTSNVVQRTCTISYLPASSAIRLVSADQATSDNASFTFANAALSFEGLFTPDAPHGLLDESIAVVFEENGIASETFVAYRTDRGATLLAKRLRTSGTAIVLQSPWRSSSSILVDPLGASLAAASVVSGDTVRLGGDIHSVSAASGRAMTLTPTANTPLSETLTTAAAAAGALSISVQSASGIAINDSIMLAESPGAGWYRIFQISGSTLAVGNILSAGTLTDGGSYSASTEQWLYTGDVPADISVMPWVFQDPAALTGTPVRVLSIVRTAGAVYLILPLAATFTGTVSLVAGLRGSVPLASKAVLFTIGNAAVASSSAITASKAFTLYSSETVTDLPVGTMSIPAVGMAQTDVRTGDLVVWDFSAGTLTAALLSASGGDGTLYTSVVSHVTDSSISFVPALPVEVLANTAWAVTRNGPRETGIFGALDTATSALLDTTQTGASGNDITLAAWARGLGDGSGLAIIGRDIQTLTITTVAEPTVTLADASTLAVGDIVSQASNYWNITSITGNTISVVLCRDIASGSPSTFLAAGAITVARIRSRIVASSQLGSTTSLFFAAARQARTITFSATSYASPSPSDINRAVKQTVGAVSYTGTLAGYDVAARTWSVVPNDLAIDSFAVWSSTGDETFIVGGAGSGRTTVVSSPAPSGYVGPVGGDVGLKVRQGPYTGTLISYSTSTWFVRPDSASDLFDRTDIPTYVDRSNDVAQDSTEPYGYLRAPADAPQFGAAVAGPVTLTLDAPTDFANGASISVYSRMGRLGGLGVGSTFSVAPGAGLNTATFNGLVPGTVQFTLPVGPATGPYAVGALATRADTSIGFTSAVPTAVSIPYGHAQVTVLGATVSAGATTVTFPTTTIGLFGHAGRLLRVKILSDTYYLPIQAAGATNDSVVLAVGFPVGITSGTQVTVAVVDGYVTPFYASTIAAMPTYHITEPPAAATQTPVTGLSAVVGAVGTLSDSSIDFGAALYGSSGLQLHLDAGQNASITPYPITAVSTHLVNFTGSGLVSESFVPYHITHRPSISYTSYIGYMDGSVLRMSSVAELSNYAAVRLRIVPLYTSAAAETRNISSITGTAVTLDTASALPNGTAVLVYIVRMDRTATTSVPGTALFTYNYYANTFMDLPVVRLLSVELLDPTTLAPVRALPFEVTPVRPGYRYSAQEVNDLVILDSSAIGFPMLLTYSTDPTISQIDSYLVNEDTKNQCTSILAKRMESIVVSIAVTVRSDRTTADLQDLLSQYIIGITSRQPVSKDGIIKYLYDQQVVSSVDIRSFVLSGVYYREDGVTVAYGDSASIYGAETATYLAGAITVNKVNA